MIRILLVDDHAQFRRCVRDLIERQAGLAVVGEAADGAAAVDAACTPAATGALPDVVLMDLRMRGIDGIEATRRLMARRPGLAVLALSSHDDPPLVRAFIEAGGSGYMLKGDPLTDLVDAIRAVAAGERRFSRGLDPAP